MIYSGTITSKTQELVPVFSSGRPAHSKYNPSTEKISIDENFNGCLVIAGIAGGFHIENILKTNTSVKIICVEADTESLNFVSSLERVKKILTYSNVTACTIQDLDEIIIKKYIPHIHKNLSLVFLRSWENEIGSFRDEIIKKFKYATDSVSRDFSVQCHFGKLWHRNILLNMKFISDMEFKNEISIPEEIQKSKTAAIIAAGPSLDLQCKKILSDRTNYFVISTDTAFGSLLQNKIIPDAVISIDPQHISAEHFYCTEKSPILYIFDISSNPETVKRIFNMQNRISFVRSAHPMAAIASKYFFIPQIETGAGTVTIAAADWALKNGFIKLEFFGADFAYSDGKPYCKGTYLEQKFLSTSRRISTSEQMYTALMFRTELNRISKSILSPLGKNAATSKILESYGSTLFQWAKNNNLEISENVFTSKIIEPQINPQPEKYDKCFDFTKDFFEPYLTELKKFCENISEIPNTQLEKQIFSNEYIVATLPLLAALKNHDIHENFCLAYNFLLYYNL